MENTSVLQNWLMQIPIRMQSTLILGLRGPDTHRAKGVKELVRWLRGLAFKPGNPENVAVFMASMPPAILEKSSVAQELEFCTQHYYSHLMHAFEVVAYRHPDSDIRTLAYIRFDEMCSLFHLPVEAEDEFEERLKSVEWPGGVQPDDFDDAIAMLDAVGRNPLKAY